MCVKFLSLIYLLDGRFLLNTMQKDGQKEGLHNSLQYKETTTYS